MGIKFFVFCFIFLLKIPSFITRGVSGTLVAQLVKNPPTMWETWVRSLGWEEPLEKGKATHSSTLASRIPWTGQSWTRLSGFHLNLLQALEINQKQTIY